MARHEDVQTSIWTADDDFIDLSADAKLIAIWSFTNEHANTAGLYRVARRVIQRETTLPPARFDKAFGELLASGFASYEGGVLWVRSRAKRLRNKSPNMAKGVANDVDVLDEDHPLRNAFLRAYKQSSWLKISLSKFKPLEEASENGSGEPKPEEAYKPLEGSLGTGIGISRSEGSSVAVNPDVVEADRLDERRAVRELFDFWVAECRPSSTPKPKLTDERRQKLRARLRDGYSPRQIATAIRGAAVAAFVDERGKRHDDLTLICRNGSKLEDFIGRAATQPGGAVTLTPEQVRAAEERRIQKAMSE